MGLTRTVMRFGCACAYAVRNQSFLDTSFVPEIPEAAGACNAKKQRKHVFLGKSTANQVERTIALRSMRLGEV